MRNYRLMQKVLFVNGTENEDVWSTILKAAVLIGYPRLEVREVRAR